MRVLVIEDNCKLAALLARAMRETGFAVDVAHEGGEGVWLATEHDYDAIVLDVGLPDIDGFEVCRRLRAAEQWAPIIMLTARDATCDRVTGLDCGADDYVVKPFDFDELLARLRALHRRGARARPTVLTVGDLSVDPASRHVERAGVPIELSATEFSVLEALMRRSGTVVSRRELLECVWDFAFDGDPHIVTVYVAYLRDKIDRPFGRASIETVRGAGYRIVDERRA